MRIRSGIKGLDELTKGGFPKDTITLVSGPPGSAKSLFATQYIYNGVADYDETGIFVSLEESRENIMRAAKPYGMDFSKFEGEGKIHLLDFGEMRKETTREEELSLGIVSFDNLLDMLLRLIGETGAKRLVIDSISAIGIYYTDVDELRREMFRFCRVLKTTGVTTILVAEAGKIKEKGFGVEEFVVDSIVDLGYENVDGEYRRTMTIYKMRFTKHDPYKHPFLITNHGIDIDYQEIIY